MAATKNTHCLIDVLGRPRRLFSVDARKQGDLLIAHRPADAMGGEFGPLHGGKEIVEQRHSIHPSPGSRERVTCIKFTQRFADGSEQTERHYTAALKQHRRFAHIASVACPDLRLDKYVPERKAEQTLWLGMYDPAVATLTYGIFVGNREQAFPDPRAADIGLLHKNFGLFRLAVLWSFLPVPSGPFRSMLQTRTHDPRTVPEPLKEGRARTARGHSAEECVAFFLKTRDALLQTPRGRTA